MWFFLVYWLSNIIFLEYFLKHNLIYVGHRFPNLPFSPAVIMSPKTIYKYETQQPVLAGITCVFGTIKSNFFQYKHHFHKHVTFFLFFWHSICTKCTIFFADAEIFIESLALHWLIKLCMREYYEDFSADVNNTAKLSFTLSAQTCFCKNTFNLHFHVECLIKQTWWCHCKVAKQFKQ